MKHILLAIATLGIIALTVGCDLADAKGSSGAHLSHLSHSSGHYRSVFSLAPRGYTQSSKTQQNLGRTRAYFHSSYGFH